METVNEQRNTYMNFEKNVRDFYVPIKGGDINYLLIFFIQEYLKFHPDFSPKLSQFISSNETNNSSLREKYLFEKNNPFQKINFQSLSAEEFRHYYNSLLHISLENKSLGAFVTPALVIDLMIEELGDIQPNQVIYDPTCGIGSFFIAIHKKFPNHQLKFIGQDINKDITILCQINLLVNGIDEAEIILGDSLENPPLNFKQKIDIAVCNPPFNDKKIINDLPSSEYAFVKLILSMLNKQGKALILVPERFLFVEDGEIFRKRYVENDWIESIISLPADTFKSYGSYGSIKTSLIKFNFDKKEFDYDYRSDKKGVKGFIRFEKKYYSDKHINIDENHYKYFDEDNKECIGTNYYVYDLRWQEHRLANNEYDIAYFNSQIKQNLSMIWMPLTILYKYLKLTFIINKNNTNLIEFIENSANKDINVNFWNRFDYRREITLKKASKVFVDTGEYDAYGDFDSDVVEIDIYLRLYVDIEINPYQNSSLIEQKDYNLSVSQYVHENKKEVDTILYYVKEPDKVCLIKDLIDSERLGVFHSPNITKYLSPIESENLPYILIGDLAKNKQSFYLDISKIERKIKRENAKIIVDYSAILVSLLGNQLKPSYFHYADKPIVVGSDILILKPKGDVNIEFFLTQLYSRLVQLQLEINSRGSVINRINKDDFLSIKIIIPSIEEQERQALEMRAFIQEKISLVEQKLSQFEYEIIANINHSLKNKLGTIINDYDTLIGYLKRKNIDFSELIFPLTEEENIEDIDTVEKITTRIRTNLLDATKVFRNAEKIQRQNLKKELVGLVGYFREDVKALYHNEKYKIEVINLLPKGEKIIVPLDKDAFKDALENLIENAKVHGFLEKDRVYKIIFELDKYPNPKNIPADEMENTQFYARIFYKNDGKPFPKDFSFEEYKQFSNKAGKTQGTGIGGYVINRVIGLHQGKFNFIKADESSPFQVQFEILLPLEK